MPLVARSRPHWLLALPLAAAACLGGHGIGYRLGQAGQQEAALHGYFRYLPLVFALASALLALALGLRIGGRLPGRPSAWPYALVPPLAYLGQELAERAMAGTGLEGLTHPAVLAGLLVQLPLAVLAYLAARALLRCADLVARALAGSAWPAPAPPLLAVPSGTVAPLPARGVRVGQGRAPPR